MEARLNDYARAIMVHPRIIWKALHGEATRVRNWKWSFNPVLNFADVCDALRAEPEVLERCLKERDYMLTVSEAAALLRLNKDYFRLKKYLPAVNYNNRLVRWSYRQIKHERKLRKAGR